MPRLKKMHESLRSGVNGAKGRFGPSRIALSGSFKNANWSKEGSAFGNMLKKNLQLSTATRSLRYSKQGLRFTIVNQPCYFFLKKEVKKKEKLYCVGLVAGGYLSITFGDLY